jgi:uncharacterized lipoprotein YddW (UPF0748 family)
MPARKAGIYYSGPILLRSFPTMRPFLLCLLFAAGHMLASAQAPKREFRAAWIATVGNIDWPLKQGLPAEEQRQTFIRRLDQMRRMGMNAVIVQIRPAADAFYPSAIEPWSHYLTGKQGVPPNPYYDPLEFMISETHKRSMEFHAWFNPFRALVDSRKNPNPAAHVTRLHPDWVVSYGGKSYLNPGIPDAREYVTDVIIDVVKRYDIDAVHLDDYFYPYRIPGVAFNDAKAFAKYNPGNIANKDDWRRNNINVFIQNLNERIKTQKTYVKLGVSPFGVWRNAGKDSAGSPTRAGQTDYDDLYADVRGWMQQGWIDYALPQLYWEHGHRLAAFERLLTWWRDHAYGREVYFGLGLYRMLGAPAGAYAGTHEILSQISDTRRLAPGTGWALYSLSNLDKIIAPIEDSLEAYGKTFALVPQMKWIDSLPPQPPVVKGKLTAVGFFLQWTQQNPANEYLRYIVYRFNKGERIDLNDAAHIVTITQDVHYVDAEKTESPVYVVTTIDRLWNESTASNKVARE